MIELRLLAHPENAEREKTHQVDQQVRHHGAERVPERGVTTDLFPARHMQVEQEERHRHPEDAVAECGQPLHARSGDQVVGDPALAFHAPEHDAPAPGMHEKPGNLA
jgi:hypothetical protein